MFRVKAFLPKEGFSILLIRDGDKILYWLPDVWVECFLHRYLAPGPLGVEIANGPVIKYNDGTLYHGYNNLLEYLRSHTNKVAIYIPNGVFASLSDEIKTHYVQVK